MHIIKKILKYLLIFLILLAIGGYFFTNSLKPTYRGKLKLKGLKNTVTVFYDDYGIPHIYAKNELDARRALGFIHAQDRLWQMELLICLI